MASTDMMQAAVDSRYAKELYSNTQYQELEKAQKQICIALLSGVFGDKQFIEKNHWLEISLSE